MSDLPDGIHGGWVDDPDAVAEIAALQPFLTMADTPAGQAPEIPEKFFGWDVYRKVLGSEWQCSNQGKVGSCVSFGTAAAIEMTMVCELFAGQAELFTRLATEVIYAGSRVEVGGGKVRGDGSVGAWGAEFVKRWGVVPREVIGKYDLRSYNEERCREWGKTGVPDDLEPEAKLHPINAITKVLTANQARQSLASGYGISVSSSQGFTLKRDSNGFCQPSGTWRHCMAIIGYAMAPKPAFFILNSWGPETHTGPTGQGDPPPCGFWADAAVVEGMLAVGDSWAFSDLAGFPAKSISWVI